MADFDKQIKGIFNTVRSTINPDYAIPKDKENEPMNVRIKRMKESADMLTDKLKGISDSLTTFNTNLSALTEEIQPYLDKESAKAAESPADSSAPAEKTGAVDPTSEEVVTEDKKADTAEKPVAEDKPAEDKPAEDKPADETKEAPK